MQIAAREIVLWTTPSEPPKALQASECSELLDPMRASCLILAQHQPGKFDEGCRGSFAFLQTQRRQVLLLVRPPRTISPVLRSTWERSILASNHAPEALHSYLLGLLAMIKCSICSYQCDN